MPSTPLITAAVRQLPAGDVAQLAAGLGRSPSDEELLQFRFRPGDRVIVLDTGEECEVIRGRRINTTVAIAKS